MAFIQPLNFEQWFINVFAGNPDIFGAIAIMVIASMSAYFRMSGVGLFFIIGLFVLMFSGFIGTTFLTVMGIIGGLVIGFTLSKIFNQ
jgi:hypothetical protein